MFPYNNRNTTILLEHLWTLKQMHVDFIEQTYSNTEDSIEVIKGERFW